MSSNASSPSAVIPFQFRHHEVRAVTIDGEPWFVARDVCDILGLDNLGMALAKIPEQHLTSIRLMSGGQTREMKAVDEPGLYRLILRSDKPQAEPFMEWVTSEVLPTIRKTGAYIQAVPGDFNIPLTAEVLAMRPSLRLRLYNEARHTAALAGGGPETVQGYFLELCRMMAARQNAPAGSESLTRFIDECLEEAKGWNTPFRDILAAFHRWWAAAGSGHPPSPKALAVAVGWRFERYKSSGMVYRNCRLRRPALDDSRKEARHE